MTLLPLSRRTGSPLAWARDLGLIGGVTSYVLPSMMGPIPPAGFAGWAGGLGALGGVLLGLAAPALLDLVRGRVAIRWLVLLAPLVGAAWGGSAGALAGLLTDPGSEILGLLAGGIAGAMQLGVWWFPYTFQTVRGARSWPVVVGALVVSPLLIAPVYAGTLVLLGLSGGLS